MQMDDVAPAVQRAIQWTLARRSGNGAWAAFDRDNGRALVYRMPFIMSLGAATYGAASSYAFAPT